jgi:CheY-specific phosphatase CheX
MDHIALLKGTEEVRSSILLALEKFEKIFTRKIQCSVIATVSGYLNLLGETNFDVVFIDQLLADEDINLLKTQANKVPPKTLFAAEQKNFELLSDIIDIKSLKCMPGSLDKQNIFKLLQSLIAPAERKIDPRVLSSILTGVMHVIQQNTSLTVTPRKVAASRSSLAIQDVTAICSFNGDGIQGAIIATTTIALVRKFAQTMFALDENEITNELQNDLMLEILNQISGVVSLELQQYSYDFKPTIFFVSIGEQHSYFSRTNGKYFEMPFNCAEENLGVTFCYDIYLTPGVVQHERYVDVRLLTAARKAVAEVLLANMRCECRHVKDKLYAQEVGSGQIITVAHGVGVGSSYTAIMCLAEQQGKTFASKMLQIPEDEISLEMIADTAGEILNQVVAFFRGQANTIGYPMRTVFHADFSKASQMSYLVRGNGQFVTMHFEVDDFLFQITLGIISGRTPPLLDISGWLREMSA